MKKPLKFLHCHFTESQTGRGQKGPLGFISSNPLAQSRVAYSRLLRAISRQVLNISKNVDSQPLCATYASFLIILNIKKVYPYA